MPLIETKGAASAQGFGEFAKTGEAVYVESVFSTYLYTGNGSTQTITNGIDLAGKGGLVWIKNRTSGYGHYIFDTLRGATYRLASNGSSGQSVISNTLSSFSSTGFGVGTDVGVNANGEAIASWTFREQSKFFDVVTWTGTGSNTTISHNLGAVPGCIIVKRTDTTADWQVYHRSNANTEYMVLNDTAAKATGTTRWNSTTPTSTVFSIGTDATVNASGGTYVAYLFAHDAGGFGASGTDNVISCGSFTTDGSSVASVTLGYEPQWVLIKKTSGTGDWNIWDVMRGWGQTNTQYLFANSNIAENPYNYSTPPVNSPTATGFTTNGILGSSSTYIYIAIRRGPMRTPTSGTSVYNAIARSGTGAAATVTGVGFAPDLLMSKIRDSTVGTNWSDRLRGPTQNLDSSSTSAEATSANRVTALGQDGFSLGTASEVNASGFTYINWNFRRAPGFFDVVCLNSTTSAAQVLSHNLGVAPEIIISKRRNGTSSWQTMDATNYLRLNTDQADLGVPTYHTFTSTTFSIDSGACSSGENWVFYLFASCPGVSKVGSYTGTGTTLQIDCGFTAGSRFVLIKRTDSTGDWYVWDSARGIVAGNDPYLLLNSTAAEVTSTDYVDTYNAGFEISSTAPAAINANGGTFIFLAIA